MALSRYPLLLDYLIIKTSVGQWKGGRLISRRKQSANEIRTANESIYTYASSSEILRVGAERENPGRRVSGEGKGIEHRITTYN